MKYYRYIVAAVAVLALVLGCKKDDDEETYPSLNGAVKFTMPLYVYAGDVIHICPTGIYRENKADTLLAVYAYDSSRGVRDTIRFEGDGPEVKADFYFTVPDTIGFFYLSVSYDAEDYYARSSTRYYQIVDTLLNTGTLRGYEFAATDGEFTDPRDGRTYRTLKAGTSEWMKQNLAYEKAGSPRNGDRAASFIFGRYYTWTEASGTLCPEGWHLPSDTEFIALAEAAGATSVTSPADIPDAAGRLMGDIYFVKNKMWEFWPEVKITDDLGFSAIPSGYAQKSGSSYTYYGMNQYACFWTADEVDSDFAVARYIYHDKNTVVAARMPKESFAASVRCVR